MNNQNQNININIKEINSIIHSLKETINKSKICVPDGHKIVYVPIKVTKITYNIGRFIVTQNLSIE